MRRAMAVLPAGSFAEGEGSITLAAHDRYRRRIRLTDDQGGDCLLDLPVAVLLRDGEGLALEDGGIITVRAADEAVMDLSCADSAQLARLAWHLGNRHVPLQFLEGNGIRVCADPTLPALAQRLGVGLVRRQAPFQPEPGAYDPHGLMAAPPPVVRRA